MVKHKLIKNRVALVTGGSRGIGLSAAKILAEMDYNIAICSRNKEELDKASSEINAICGMCFSRSIDVSKKTEVISFVEEVHNLFGRVDVLVNNAGMQLNKPFIELSSNEWQHILEVNLYSHFYFCKEVGKYMIAQNSGKIINISSVLSKFGLPGRAPYSVSKAGIEALTRVLATEWAEYNILVNAIAPGHVNTELVRRDIRKGLLDEESLKQRSVLLRIGNVDEIGSIIAFLSSDASSFITGQTFVVDGGFSIKK